jgi:hypothetical protein
MAFLMENKAVQLLEEMAEAIDSANLIVLLKIRSLTLSRFFRIKMSLLSENYRNIGNPRGGGGPNEETEKSDPKRYAAYGTVKKRY